MVKVGDKFNRQAFFDTLEEAEVNSLTFFALCHHGHSYFNTTTGVRHPGLDFDLLEQVADEAHRRKMELLVYFSMNVNEMQAARHPDWHAQFADGKSVNTQMLLDGTELFWTWLCPNRGSLPDGVFLPSRAGGVGPLPVERHFCGHGLLSARQLPLPRLRGADAGQGSRSGQLGRSRRLQYRYDGGGGARVASQAGRQAARSATGDSQLQRLWRGRRAAGVISEFYIESLAFQTGWEYFPMAASYFRRFGLPIMGMTGRFLKNWGDFGTLVSADQLKMQVGHHLMAGASTCIGDHLHCNGSLDTAVYKTIGEVYRWLKPLQPYAVDLRPLKEVAILAPVGLEGNAASMDKNNDVAAIQNAMLSATLMMTELHRPYEVITKEEPLDEYAVLIMTHALMDDAFVEKAREFVTQAGSSWRRPMRWRAAPRGRIFWA